MSSAEAATGPSGDLSGGLSGGLSASLVARLRTAGCVHAEEEAALLEAEAADAAGLLRAVQRRVEGEPLEHVLGWAAFAGLRVAVDPGVFVPRRRTEALVELGARAIRRAPRPVVVDLCCGSGAVSMALGAAVAGAIDLYAVDLDPVATACARRNLGAARVHQGDLYDALPADLRGRVDLIVANAPYVPTSEISLMPSEARLHEPRVALDGGADGLDLHRRLARGAPTWLAPGGILLLETSTHQAHGTAQACVDAGLGADVLTRPELESTVVRAISDPRQSSGTMTG